MPGDLTHHAPLFATRLAPEQHNMTGTDVLVIVAVQFFMVCSAPDVMGMGTGKTPDQFFPQRGARCEKPPGIKDKWRAHRG